MQRGYHLGSCCGYSTLQHSTTTPVDQALATRLRAVHSLFKDNLELHKQSFVFVLSAKLQNDNTVEVLRSLKKEISGLTVLKVGDALFITFCSFEIKQRAKKSKQNKIITLNSCKGEPSGYTVFSSSFSFDDAYWDEQGYKLDLASAKKRFSSVSSALVKQFLDTNHKGYMVQTHGQYSAYADHLDLLGFKPALLTKNPNTGSSLYLLVRGEFSEINLD